MEAILSNIYILALIVGLIGAVGDSFLNQYADQGGLGWLLAGYGVWILTATILTFLFRGEIFGRAVVLFFMANIIFALLIGRILFAERLSLLQWLGILGAIPVIILLTRGN